MWTYWTVDLLDRGPWTHWTVDRLDRLDRLDLLVRPTAGK